MSHTAGLSLLSDQGRVIESHWNALARTRRLYTLAGLAVLLLALSGSLWFANDTNSGKFLDRLPHLFDFVETLIPRDGREIWRAMFDLPSPYDDGSLKYNYPEGRFYITQTLYIPEYFYKMIETLNIALVSTLLGGMLGFCLSFMAARNMMPSKWVRWPARRFMEVLRAFPEVVLAGFFLAILSLGPIPAMIAVSVHTVGALGKLFFEVVENADMKPDEGLHAVGGNWLERLWFGMVPQVMPNFISYALLRMEINVRASTIIGAVGGGGIGEPLRLSISQGHAAKTVAIVMLLLTTVIAVDQFSAWLRRKLVGEQAFHVVA
ncbi:phosphonate ABC transporter, permease protein PhnE [Allorhizobium taibaishanense]|uniref:Phosphonate ABC transporter, permease protein PhnE n=1 Tax=Allorhizobium taibaishanense TaxID=887144 RepID=A0A1Q9A8K3_9HYPH|nr:phosphonate ABC transporter, permease protein PhnE [Allorhizobium taibaishanense]MBB4009611.1 phosphonate transport system permease protein [Allorhizobium taibaishanense]OLP50867.1 phosphonate ABC transporter, permease protein PhnE [Allorhizobium taibaishanense]